MPDITVVGGGPAGSTSAALLAGSHDVTVVEDHVRSGVPLQCTGLISPEVLELSGVRPTVLNEFSVLRVHFPNGRTFSVDCGETKAVLIDRSELDLLLSERAMDAGAEFLTSVRCRSCDIGRDGVTVRLSSGEEIGSRAVVGADGHSSVVRRAVGCEPPRMVVRGMQMDLRHTCDEQDTIDVWTGSDVAPGFFGWTIPYGDSVRVGLCTEWRYGAPNGYMPALLKKAGLDGSGIIAKSCGKIPLGLQDRTYSDRTLLIGDAACQVKPVSGGGLYPIFKSAPCLVHVLDKALGKDDLSASSLSEYQRLWRREVGRELKDGFRLRRMYNNLRDDELDTIGGIVDRDSVRRAVSSASIDSPSSMVPGIMRNIPLAIRLLPIMVKAVIR
ncbi:MAG: NAD(P)/FAD-dependent oxidoreductase [Candidatus Methanomethylophilaceae archaeon]